MTDDNMALTDLLQKAGEGDFLRTLAETVLQMLMEADVDGHVGAGRHERHPDRLNYRNGYRDRALDTRLGTLNLAHPQAAAGQLLPALSGGAQDQREGPGGGDPGGLDRWRFHPARR